VDKRKIGIKAHDIGELFVYGSDGRSKRPSWLTREHLRYVAAIGCVILPFVFLAIFQSTIHSVRMGAVTISETAVAGPNCVASDEPDKSVPSNDLRALTVRAGDISGQYSFGISSAALRFISVIAVGFAFFVIFRRTTPLAGAITCMGSLAFGLLLSSLPHNDGTRTTLVVPIAKAVESARLSGTDLSSLVNQGVAWNNVFAVVATVVLLCAVGVVAIRARDEELKAAILRQRLFDLRWSMILAAAVLVTTVVITRALVDWHLAFLCDPYAQPLKPIGAALANYWGAGSSGFLLAAFLPAYFSWTRDVVRWTAITQPDGNEKERRSLVESEGLDFAPTTSAVTLLTMAIPALSGPLLEVFKNVLPKVG
jgi:hypothetical protein